MKERDHLEDVRADRMIILRRIFIIQDGGLGRIYLAHGRKKLQVLTNTVMNLPVP